MIKLIKKFRFDIAIGMIVYTGLLVFALLAGL